MGSVRKASEVVTASDLSMKDPIKAGSNCSSGLACTDLCIASEACNFTDFARYSAYFPAKQSSIN
jgi:epoxyqueuosine reductase QueG